MIVFASDNVPYAKTAQVWRLARRWDARFVNAGPFGHINAESEIADWPYGQYLLASLQPAPTPALADEALRSEEHTSELQSLMRISYAVFCLKKKNKTNCNDTQHISHANPRK